MNYELPTKTKISLLIESKKYDEVIKIIKPFINSYKKTLNDIIKFLNFRKVKDIIIPAMGSIIFMRLIQHLTKNKFKMYPAPMSSSLDTMMKRKDFFKLKIRDIIEENLKDVKEKKIIKIGLIDEIISGSSLKEFRREFKNQVKEILSTKYKRLTNKKELELSEELTGVTIEFYVIGIIDLLKSWFDKNPSYKMTDHSKEINSELECLKNKWVTQKEPIKEFIELSEKYAQKLADIYIEQFDRKVQPENFHLKKQNETLMFDKTKTDKDIIIKIYNTNFIVASLFTEDIKELSGMKYLNILNDFPIIIRNKEITKTEEDYKINDILFKLILKELD